MKIAYFITGLGLGGAETATINLANSMVDREHKVMIVYLNGDNEHSAKIAPAINVVGLNMSKTPIGMLRALNKAAKLMRISKPDVVHGQMVHANLFIRLLRLFVRLPKVVCTEHSMDIRGRGRMIAYRYTDFLSDVNTNVSTESTNQFMAQKAFSEKKSCVMYNGVDTAKYTRQPNNGLRIRAQYGVNEDEFLFLHVGRLTEAKDHRNLINALSKVPNAKLLLLGKGELQEQIKAQINELGLDQRVIMAGAHANVVDYYSAADCLVISSAWEGMPMVVIEAMAAGLPIVTTNVGGADETVNDSRWIVPIKNSEALAKVMTNMLELSLVERQEIAQRNVDNAKKFDTQTICSNWEELYSSVSKSLSDRHNSIYDSSSKNQQ